MAKARRNMAEIRLETAFGVLTFENVDDLREYQAKAAEEKRQRGEAIFGGSGLASSTAGTRSRRRISGQRARQDFIGVEVQPRTARKVKALLGGNIWKIRQVFANDYAKGSRLADILTAEGWDEARARGFIELVREKVGATGGAVLHGDDLEYSIDLFQDYRHPSSARGNPWPGMAGSGRYPVSDWQWADAPTVAHWSSDPQYSYDQFYRPITDRLTGSGGEVPPATQIPQVDIVSRQGRPTYTPTDIPTYTATTTTATTAFEPVTAISTGDRTTSTRSFQSAFKAKGNPRVPLPKCPSCKAGRGKPCVTRRGTPAAQTHKARKERAAELMERTRAERRWKLQYIERRRSRQNPYGCPTCGACGPQQCLTNSGRPTRPHKKRAARQNPVPVPLSTARAKRVPWPMAQNAGPYLPEMFPYGQGGRPAIYALNNGRYFGADRPTAIIGTKFAQFLHAELGVPFMPLGPGDDPEGLVLVPNESTSSRAHRPWRLVGAVGMNAKDVKREVNKVFKAHLHLVDYSDDLQYDPVFPRWRFKGRATRADYADNNSSRVPSRLRWVEDEDYSGSRFSRFATVKPLGIEYVIETTWDTEEGRGSDRAVLKVYALKQIDPYDATAWGMEEGSLVRDRVLSTLFASDLKAAKRRAKEDLVRRASGKNLPAGRSRQNPTQREPVIAMLGAMARGEGDRSKYAPFLRQLAAMHSPEDAANQSIWTAYRRHARAIAKHSTRKMPTMQALRNSCARRGPEPRAAANPRGRRGK